MKKRGGAIIFLVVLILLLGSWLLTRKAKTYRAHEILPAETIALLDFPTVQLSRKHFNASALGRILAEPEIRALNSEARLRLKKALPTTQKENFSLAKDFLRLLMMVEGESFIALTDVSVSPRLDAGMLIGFDPGSRRKEAEVALEALVRRCRIEDPESELLERDSGPIAYQVWRSSRKLQIAFVQLGNFFLFSNGEAPLQQVLACVDDDSLPTLNTQEAYQPFIERSVGADSFLFLNADAVLGKLKPLFFLQPKLKAQLESFLPFHVMGIVSSFRNGGVENTSWSAATPSEMERFGRYKPCERRTLVATGKDTLLYGAANLEWGSWLDLLSAQGVRLTEGLLGEVGPEYGLDVEWSDESWMPSVSIIVQSSKPQALQATMEKTFMWLKQQPSLGGGRIEKTKGTGATVLTLKLPRYGPAISPSFTTTDAFAILSINRKSLDGVLRNIASPEGSLARQSQFQDVDSKVLHDYYQFLYVDQKRCFERLYGILQNASAWPEVSKKVHPYVDLSRLPHVETISRHLSPSVWSSSMDSTGFRQSSFAPMDAQTVPWVLMHALENGE